LKEEKIILDHIDPIQVLGSRDKHIQLIESAYPDATVSARGHIIFIKGSDEDVSDIKKLVEQMILTVERKGRLTDFDIETLLLMTRSDREIETPSYLNSEVIIKTTAGNPVTARTPGQKELVEKHKHNDILFAIGPAGTGKTYTAVALAARALKEKRVKKIVLCRPAVEAGESLGFLPGDLKEKIDPYLRPLYDALEEMIEADKLEFYIQKKIIEIVPLAYMRGRTLNNAFIILDEGQNTTHMQMKMFLTRLGIHSKAIITGDITQTDLPTKIQSGLVSIQTILSDVKGIDFVYLDGKDVVRHKLIRDIIDAYERHA
jgi:phosphate starvation-inducible protein PhoH and related proteins